MKFATIALTMAAAMMTSGAEGLRWDRTEGPYARCFFSESGLKCQLFMTQKIRPRGDFNPKQTKITGLLTRSGKPTDTPSYRMQWFSDDKCTDGNEYGEEKKASLESQRGIKQKLKAKFKN